MDGQVNLPSYTDLGFSKFLEKPIGQSGLSEPSAPTGSSYGGQLNFDQVQTTGSLGDRIQVGGTSIIIDGSSKRIIINDGQNDRVVIGQL